MQSRVSRYLIRGPLRVLYQRIKLKLFEALISQVHSKHVNVIASAFFDLKYFLKINLFGNEEGRASFPNSSEVLGISNDFRKNVYENSASKRVFLFFDKFFYSTQIESDNFIGLEQQLSFCHKPHFIHQRQEFLNQPNSTFFSGDNLIFDGNQLNSKEIPRLEQLIARGVTVTVIAQDSWNITYLNRLSTWARFATKIVYFDSNSEIEKYISHDKLILAIPPRSTSMFKENNYCQELPIKIGFSGSQGPGRIEWARKLFAITNNMKNVELDLLIYSKGAGFPPAKSHSDYEAWLASLDVLLNFTFKEPDKYILNGRSLDAIASGKTLLQQVGLLDPLSSFFTPFEHYLPFHDWSTLKNSIFQISQTSRGELRAMGKAAQAHHARTYADFYNQYIF